MIALLTMMALVFSNPTKQSANKCRVLIDFNKVKNQKFDTMEIGTKVIIYCSVNRQKVKIQCFENGIANEWKVDKVCKKPTDCISEVGQIKNLMPKKQKQSRKQKNGSIRKYVCRNNTQKALINGLYYNELDIQCNSGLFQVANVPNVYSNGEIQCQGPLKYKINF